MKELRQRQIAQSLQTIAIDLNSDLDERQLLQNILQQLAQVIRYDSSGLLLTDGNDLTLREEIGFDAPNLAEFRISLSDTAAPEIKVMTQAEAIMVADVSINLAWRNWTTETAVGAWMGAPLLVNQKSIGVLTVHEHTPNVYAAEDLTTLQAFANQAATALNNARLLKETHSAREIAESANRAKSAFLAAMSHELRTPLNGVLGYAQILQNNNQLAPEQRRGLEVIERSGNHLLNLINEVLDLAKIESGRFELESISFDLPDLLANVVSFFEVRARHKGVQLQYTAANIPNHVRGDAKRLRQILLNILGNAVKFTETGQVKLEVTMSSGTAVPSPNIIPLCFSITDSGSGIPPPTWGAFLSRSNRRAAYRSAARGQAGAVHQPQFTNDDGQPFVCYEQNGRWQLGHHRARNAIPTAN
ncbi:MAG: GAF domain-containing protein [Ardenticatenaceae bacterium]|nr:GAF domain-containing protein [Ardenticatenaceae bacterium]